MPKITVSMDGVVLNEVILTKAATTLGRRPYNDVVLDNLTVSGEHAVLHMQGDRVTVEDLHSTNGTYVGGQAVKNEELRHGDIVEMGRYRIRFEADAATGAAPGVSQLDVLETQTNSTETLPAQEGSSGLIKVLSGPAAGREMALTKVVTTIGKPGVSVAAITQRRNTFYVHHVEGDERMTINDKSIEENPCVLQSGDRIKLAGTEMQFFRV